MRPNSMVCAVLSWLLAFCVALASSASAAALVSSPADEALGQPQAAPSVHINVSGYLQVWYLIIEQAENGLKQPLTNNEAAQDASGFSINRARLYSGFDSRYLKGRVELKLEGSVGLLDAYAAGKPLGSYLEVWLGQMKIPSTYEVLEPDSDLDFSTRSKFSTEVANWSLMRSPSTTSPFTGLDTYSRDLGLGLKGQVLGASYFLMVGNGFGANLFVGANERKQFVYANDFGAYFYGARLSYDLVPLFADVPGSFPVRSAQIGGHYDWNNHPDSVFNDKRTVFDTKRWSWSWDVQVDVLDRIHLTGLMGAGAVKDDIDNDKKDDYRYSGYEAKVVGALIPEALDAAFRVDSYTDEYSENGAKDTLTSYTAGLTYTWRPDLGKIMEPAVRIRFNYKRKILDSRTNPDIRDDVFLLEVQLKVDRTFDF